MVIKETTPKQERIFTIELTEAELRQIDRALGEASHGYAVFEQVRKALKN